MIIMNFKKMDYKLTQVAGMEVAIYYNCVL